jgi:hypothetical protein
MVAMRKILLRVGFIALAALFLGGCGEDDPARAREAVSWLRMHKHDGLANQVWKITDLKLQDASHIAVSVWVPNPRHVELIRSQSLMRQSLIAKYACPPPTAGLWSIVGDEVEIRVNLYDEDIKLGNTVCKPPQQ